MAGKIVIDTTGIAQQFKNIAAEVQEDLIKGVANLAAMTHAKVVEMAGTELHSSRKTFIDNLGFEEVAPGVWVVSVNEDALWVEEGIEPGKDMKPDLLKDAKKTTKDGVKYRPIPFDYGKAPSQLTGYTQGVVARIRANLKKEGVPFKKLERDMQGRPIHGGTDPSTGKGIPKKMHEFDWGGEKPGKGNTPILKGVSIYQTLTKTGNVRRDILTFRTVSGSPASAGKWIHPGFKAKKFLDQAEQWAYKEWEEKVLPEVLSKYNGR
jgi:hypothetical protein